ncbi:glycosyltransferase family 87 protein [Bradyrhizobium sp. USDA 4451]
MSQKSNLEGRRLAFADHAAANLATRADAARGAATERGAIGQASGASTAQSSPRSGALVAAFRDADWLTADRITAFTRVLLLLFIGCVAIIPWAAPTMDVGPDFAAFWTAAKLAREGHAGDAYGDAGRAAVAAVLGHKTYAPFFYPPTSLLLWLPFALVPFATAAIIWVVATGAAYAAAVRAILKGGSIVPALAFPGVWVCALFGQNSLFSAALLGGSAVTLDRSPVIAGVLLGCFAYKPQVALLAPLVLILTRRWRALGAAATTTLVLMLAATASFGIEPWYKFFDVLPEAGAWSLGGQPGFEKFASPYAAIRLAGGSSSAAWVVQLVAAAIAMIVLIAMLRKRRGGAAEIALMVAVTGLCIPSLGSYEMVILAIPGAWLVSQALAQGWLPYERIALAALYVTPFAMVPAGANGLQLAPIAAAALIALVTRRIRHQPASCDTSAEITNR